jgi:two-component system, NarL family, sensor kinase
VKPNSSRAYGQDQGSGAVDPIDRAHAEMGARLVSIQQEIQQRIASDLHDSTCQHLIAASLTVMRIRSALGDPANAERLCDEIDASIDHALREIRAFTYLLHPQDLTAYGLKATIEQYACGFAARTSLKVTTDITPEVDRLPARTQRSLLRIIQEALTNVFRHAKATAVGVVINATESHFRLRVRDNGRGMAGGDARYGTSETSLGVGIPAMRFRLQQLGGTLEFRSTVARRSGTTLCAVFPHHPAGKRRSQRKGLLVIK